MIVPTLPSIERDAIENANELTKDLKAQKDVTKNEINGLKSELEDLS